MLFVVVDGVNNVGGVHEIVNLGGGLFVGWFVSCTSGIFVVVDYSCSVLAVVVGFCVDAGECSGDDGGLDGFVAWVA